MAIQKVGGASGSVAEVGIAAAMPTHVTLKPIPYGALGHYKVARRFVPIVNSSINTNFVAFRNPSANLAIVTKIRLRIVQIATPNAATAIESRIAAFVQRGYTAADGTGVGATLTASGNNEKKRTAMGTTGVVITETNNIAGLTGGTKTPDSDAFLQNAMWLLAAIPTAGSPPDSTVEYEPDVGAGASPLILAQNEGFTLQWQTAVPATTAGFVVYYEISWAEVTAY